MSCFDQLKNSSNSEYYFGDAIRCRGSDGLSTNHDLLQSQCDHEKKSRLREEFYQPLTMASPMYK